jgi:hypothetical protein
MSVRTDDRVVEVERDVPEIARSSLARAGYAIADLAPRDEGVGHAHLIRRALDGTFDAGTDVRADGEVSVR